MPIGPEHFLAAVSHGELVDDFPWNLLTRFLVFPEISVLTSNTSPFLTDLGAFTLAFAISNTPYYPSAAAAADCDFNRILDHVDLAVAHFGNRHDILALDHAHA